MCKKLLIIYIVFSLIFCGCSAKVTYSPNVEIPKTNKIELKKIWEIKKDSSIADFAIEGNKNYIIFDDNTLSVINNDTGKLIKSIKLSISAGSSYAYTMSVFNNICAINFSDLFLIVDTQSGNEIYKHVESVNDSMLIGNAILYKNLVIWEQAKDDTIYGVDFSTGKILWKICDSEHNSSIHLHNYKDNYLYYNSATPDQFYKFDPMTGKTIRVIKEEKGRRVGSDYLPFYNEDVGDVAFRQWLTDSFTRYYRTSSNGYTYAVNDNNFSFYGLHGSRPKWHLKFPDEIRDSSNYGKYAVLFGEKNVCILDMEGKEVVWSLAVDTHNIPRIEDDKLYVATEDGRFIAYDITAL